jgi:small-conductance mechanosensitive channel
MNEAGGESSISCSWGRILSLFSGFAAQSPILSVFGNIALAESEPVDYKDWLQAGK